MQPRGEKFSQVVKARLPVGTFLTAVADACLSLTLICCFIPIRFHLPSYGIDNCWLFGINDLIASARAFGQEVVFTYGPYAQLMNNTYNPFMFRVILAVGILIGITYAWLFHRVLRGRSIFHRIVIGCIVIMFGLVNYRESLFLIYPLLLAMYVQCCCNDSLDRVIPLSCKIEFSFSLWMLGLLPLIKGTTLVLTILSVALLALMWLIRRQPIMSIVCIVLPLVSMSQLWFLSGQSASVLPDYLSNSFVMISGYTDALSTVRYAQLVPVFVLISFVVLWMVAYQKILPLRDRFLLTGFFALTMFVSFKGVFVRQDLGHYLPYGPALVFCLFFASLNFRRRWVAFSMNVLILSVTFASLRIFDLGGLSYLRSKILDTYILPFRFSVDPRGYVGDHRRKIESALREIREDTQWPVYPGTSDFFGFNFVQLLASGNRWQPRPQFTGYLNPQGALMNRRHFISDKAPDNVFFDVQTIDSRLWSLEDAVVWPFLLTRYTPVLVKGQQIVLRKRQDVHDPVFDPAVVLDSCGMGDWIELPPTEKPVFARMQIRKTSIGKLFDFLYQAPPLEISLRLKSGEEKPYRVIAGMAEVPFLVSPLVEGAIDFRLLYDTLQHKNGKIVSAIKISSAGAWAWNPTFRMELSALNRKDHYPIHDQKIVLDVWKDLHPFPSKKDSSIAGNIDRFIQSRMVSEDSTTYSLRLKGWFARINPVISIPKTVYAVVTDMADHSYYYPLEQRHIGGILRNYKTLKLKYAGFEGGINVKIPNGPVRISFAHIENGIVCHYGQHEIKLK